MNPARRKLLYVINNSKKQENNILKEEVVEKPKIIKQQPNLVTKQVVVPAPPVQEQPKAEPTPEIKLESQVAQDISEVSDMSEPVVEAGEDGEIKKNILPKFKKFKKDVEVGE